MINHTKKHAPNVPVKIQFPTSGATSKDSATLKDIAKERTITITTSITYHIQDGKDSLGIWILSCATIEILLNNEYLIFQVLK
ncbi:MAG: hypothetical protein OEL77_05505 [Nitrosopumilus sp.]|nr:hypothetical protein [Nitrosopumilus sp.]MDH3385450.1 hypothetical protein [Nitrosopumilus sp.]